MSKVAFVDVAQQAYEAGFRGDAHATVVALAEPESGREPTASNLSDPNGGSYGLLQINLIHTKTGGVIQGWTVDDLYDPAKNLVAAYRVWDSAGSFKPWGAYTSGLHTRWLPTARAALDGRQRWQTALARAAQMQAERDRVIVKHNELNAKLTQIRGIVA